MEANTLKITYAYDSKRNKILDEFAEGTKNPHKRVVWVWRD